MDISQIDKNFRFVPLPNTDIEWHSVLQPPFSTHGVFYDMVRKGYYRMPFEVAEKVSDGVKYLSSNTSGGRIRFVTDSPFIAIKCVLPAGGIMNHMPIVGSHGFGIYTDGYYNGQISPSADNIMHAVDGKFAFEGIRYLSNSVIQNKQKGANVDIYLPLYNGVKSLFIGVKKGSTLSTANAYDVVKPIVFYGSSITQGGCASHPGNDYASVVSRWLNAEFINLGFSGSAKAEPIMRDYLASLDASVFVVDYDHNAPTASYLQDTHYALYERLRSERLETPILFVSRPDYDYNLVDNNARRDIVFQTYQKAKAQGDNNVAFVDGQKLFGNFGREGCTVDACHPNDLGFYRMAKTLFSVLKELL